MMICYMTIHYNKDDKLTMTFWINKEVPSTFKALNKLTEEECVIEIFERGYDFGAIVIS